MNSLDAETKMQFLFNLRSRGVTEASVLGAMESIDRGAFVRGIFAERAYEDVPLPISCGQTISQPSVVGLMTQALQVRSRDTVLEVGTGSGYQAGVLAKIARRVYTVDRHARLVQEARQVFARLNLSNITSLVGDGSFGMPDQAPFDRIIVTSAAEDPPGPLIAQLKVGGVMVVPVGQSNAVQTLIRVRKTDNGLDYDELRPVRFVPLLEGLGKET
jgi:protein-L-isoaspartate(D-aspartate) O-methyltransferase